MTAFFAALLRALLRTLLIEAAVVLLLTKDKAFLKGSLLINALTNPLINLLLAFPAAFCGRTFYVICAVLGEAGVFVGEGLFYALYCRVPRKKGFAVSVAANAASLCVGIISNIFLK